MVQQGLKPNPSFTFNPGNITVDLQVNDVVVLSQIASNVTFDDGNGIYTLEKIQFRGSGTSNAPSQFTDFWSITALGVDGHVIQNPSGNIVPQRNNLRFTGGVTVTDNSSLNTTIVDISGGSGSNEFFIDPGPIIQSSLTIETIPISFDGGLLQ